MLDTGLGPASTISVSATMSPFMQLS